MTAKDDARKKWKALESNPEVLTEFGRKLGLKQGWCFNDIFGVDPDLLAMVPQPCVAVILLFPSTLKTSTPASDKKDLFYLTQIPELGNACGNIATLHAFGNNRETLGFDDDSLLVKLVNEMESKSHLERGEYLNNNEEINSIHNELAVEGQTQVIEGKVDNHFVCFTAIDGNLFELDGTKPGPIDHGPIGNDGFLSAAASKIQEVYMKPNPDVLNFSMMGLTPPMEW